MTQPLVKNGLIRAVPPITSDKIVQYGVRTASSVKGESGIYFLIDDSQEGDARIVYVGSSEDISARLYSHRSDGRVFSRFAWIDCVSEFLLEELERHYVLQFQPKYNATVPNSRITTEHSWQRRYTKPTDPNAPYVELKAHLKGNLSVQMPVYYVDVRTYGKDPCPSLLSRLGLFGCVIPDHPDYSVWLTTATKRLGL